MPSYRKLTPATVEKYEALEREGGLTDRQKKALESHRGLVAALTLARARVLVERGIKASEALYQARSEIGDK